MDSRGASVWILAVALTVAAPTDGAGPERFESPMLGREAPPEAVAAWDRTIGPDGEGLPPGSGTVAEGRAVYLRTCIHCHGAEGRGGAAEALAGGEQSLTSEAPDKVIGTYWPYATTLFDYIRRSMPLDRPASLDDAEVYAVTAYLLHINGVIAEETVLDAESLPRVRMPNRDGFVPIHQPAAVDP